ncbi:phosphoglucosamine mutase [Natronobiforma cellulositropha]|uniref:phosphoglucosamine mutase n=1 Tax=Natronobiforma cellulositropha TaxID=1679076 RepID=UPI0021D58D58|nr:phosphoglucosamine mutase [Natronobiforma cellulositropha]
MFGTSGIRGTIGEEVTGALALAVGRALASSGYERVVVGRDVRESGRILRDALTAGLRECGADVVDVGVVSTPTLARNVAPLEADAGVVITASHNPAADNGIKLWLPSGKAFGLDERRAIEARIDADDYDLRTWNDLGSLERDEHAADRHLEALRRSVSLETEPSVVVDVGNGTGAITASVLSSLGCDVLTLNGQPDGSFPGRPSEPNEETLGALMAVVERTNAVVGIAHDGDADRMVAVDETGSFVPKDVLLALFARGSALEGERVAAPVDTSLAVEDALTAIGASLTRTKVGDVYVAERATEPDVVFGGEPSGAWIWPDETLCPDGPLAACKLIESIETHGPLSTQAAGVETYPIRRRSVRVDDPETVVERIEAQVLAEYERVDTLDGVRVDTGDGWFLLRASGTEPVVRVSAEARATSRAEELTAEATAIVDDAVSD